MANVLNPSLYRMLQIHFGEVKVTNAGQMMIARPIQVFLGGPRLFTVRAGEQYAVNCPFCTDTRFRLYISHRYGQPDATGRRMKFLACCHNEQCLKNPENRDDLWERLSGTESELENAVVKEGRTVCEEAREAAWPGPCVRLDELEVRHPARTYLESRGFDAARIGRFYKAAFCLDSHYFLARDRIIIPIFEHGRLKGWQARYVGELAWKDKTHRVPPKYFSMPGMRKSGLLYNWENAKEYETGVIVEGPTDVWAFGPMACCTFGSSMSEVQRRRFLAVFRKRSAVLLYDPDAMHEPHVQELIREFQKCMPGNFAAVTLPEKTDPGSLGREVLRDYVAEHAKKQGVKVRFKKHT